MSNDSNHGTNRASPAEICPKDSSDMKMHDYILHPHYQEKKEIRHYDTKAHRHKRILQKRHDHVRGIQKYTDSQRTRYDGMSLTDLPAEVIENILSYLVAPLSCCTVDPRPRNEKELEKLNELSDLRDVLEGHPFYRLAATCHTLRVTVETFARHLLHRYQGILCFDIVEQEIGVEEWRERTREMARERKMLGLQEEEKSEDLKVKILPPFRLMWVRWAYCRCVFCGNPSQRRAIFNHSIWACNTCDKKAWPWMVSFPIPSFTLRKKKRAHLEGTRNAKIFSPARPSSPSTSTHPVSSSHIKSPRSAYDWTNGLFYLKSNISTLTFFVREHDPDDSISRAAQRKKNGTLVLQKFDGTSIEVDTMMNGCNSWSSLKSFGPQPRPSKAVLATVLAPEWQSSVIGQAIATARELQ